LRKDWEKIAKECGIINIEIVKKSGEVPGIELADTVAGCIHEHLNDERKAGEFYNEYIKKKMLNMASKDLPNPNLIFFNDFNPEERTKTNIFR